MTVSQQNPYDELPYGSKAVFEMHPNRMATVARLFGLNPAPVGTCRVLEIGCAEGGNAIPVAVSLPHARVVGVDLSERQVAIGRERISKLGLGNVGIVQADLADLANLSELKAELGTFDYVCAHGVYSWIAPDLQESLLRVCHDFLAPDGVAFVSYNTFPGWHFRLVLREMALYGAGRDSEPREQVAQAREILGLLKNAGLTGDANQAFLAREWESLEGERDEYLFHELLEEHNHPCWFHEFVARAAASGLTYVADAKLGPRSASSIPPELAEALADVETDRVEREQYVDFLEKRSFRQSLLCRSERTPLSEPDPSALDLFHVTTSVRPLEPPVDLSPGVPAAFVTHRGARLTTNDPRMKAVLARLWDRFPEPVPFQDLVEHLPPPGPEGAGAVLDRLRAMLLQAHEVRFVDFLQHVPSFVAKAGSRPVASPLVRLQAAQGEDEVTSLLHRTVEIEDEVTRLVLSRLDGSRDLEGLSRETADTVVAQGLVTGGDGCPITDLARVRAILDESVGEILDHAARQALLTA